MTAVFHYMTVRFLKITAKNLFSLNSQKTFQKPFKNSQKHSKNLQKPHKKPTRKPNSNLVPQKSAKIFKLMST
jgi:hypothetical protein